MLDACLFESLQFRCTKGFQYKFREQSATSTPHCNINDRFFFPILLLLLVLQGLDGPPLADKPARFDAAMREVLAISGQLDDIRKAIAEVWADGPDSTTPPGGCTEP